MRLPIHILALLMCGLMACRGRAQQAGDGSTTQTPAPQPAQPAEPAAPSPASDSVGQQVEAEVKAAREQAAMSRQQADLAREHAAIARKLATTDANAQAQLAQELANRYRYTTWALAPGKKEKVAYLGINTKPVDPALREQMKLPRGIGLVVTLVDPKSPAGEAGVQLYDILQKIDDQWLISSQQVGILVRLHKAGDEITLSAIRAGEPITLKVKLVEKEMVVSDATSWTEGLEGTQLRLPASTVNVAHVLDELRARSPALVLKEGDQILKISYKDGERQLQATDTDGKVLFEGPIQTEEQRRAMPPEVAEQYARIANRVDLLRPAPPAAPRVRVRPNEK
ncbi:MAG: PDZ domain-containing protein [Tepidisphaeraceae bacterium]